MKKILSLFLALASFALGSTAFAHKGPPIMGDYPCDGGPDTLECLNYMFCKQQSEQCSKLHACLKSECAGPSAENCVQTCSKKMMSSTRAQ